MNGKQWIKWGYIKKGTLKLKGKPVYTQIHMSQRPESTCLDLDSQVSLLTSTWHDLSKSGPTSNPQVE